MLKADASTFETHEMVRKALALLMAEHPRALTLAVFGEDAFKARAAEAAVYTALVNAVPLPSRKSKSDPVLKSVQLFGHKSADGFARVQALAEGNLLTRSLTVQGPDELTPGVYRKRIKALAKQYGWTRGRIRFRQAEEDGRRRLLRGGAGLAGQGRGDRADQLQGQGRPRRSRSPSSARASASTPAATTSSLPNTCRACTRT